MGLCQRQLEDSVVEDWWLFPWNLLLFWMRKITKQRDQKFRHTSMVVSRECFVVAVKYLLMYVPAYILLNVIKCKLLVIMLK